VFDDDPQEILDTVIHTGYYEKQEDFGYYPTPSIVAKHIVHLAEIEDHHTVLEPSAGQGHIIEELTNTHNVICGELLERNRKILQEKGFNVEFTNFLTYKEKKFDRIIMNPPFGQQADIDHVNHAYSLLNEGGKLVSIMSSGVTFRSNNKTVEFRKLIEQNGYIENLPENSFHTSGTNVNTVIVVLNK
jgi:type I restriction-modification system DNA methylase subunit